MSKTKKPTKSAEPKASVNKTFMQRNWAAFAIAVVGLLGALIIGALLGTPYAVGTGLCAFLLVVFVVDFHYNSTKAGPSTAKVHMLAITPKKAAATRKDDDEDEHDEDEAENEPTIADEDFTAAADALKALGYDVMLMKPGAKVSEHVAKPEDAADPVGTRVEIGLKILMVLAVAFAVVFIIFSSERLLKSTIESFWGRKAPVENVSGTKDVPVFTTDLMSKVKLSSNKKTLTVPRFTDGTLWCVKISGKDGIVIEKQSSNETLKVVEGLDTLTITGKDDGFTFPGDVQLYYMPNDGRKASEAKTLDQIASAKK